MKTLLKNRELSAFFAIVALFVVLVALNPAYFSLQTLAMIFASSQILCLLALGATGHALAAGSHRRHADLLAAGHGGLLADAAPLWAALAARRRGAGY